MSALSILESESLIFTGLLFSIVTFPTMHVVGTRAIYRITQGPDGEYRMGGKLEYPPS
jgi:hypothetical protein